MPRAERVDLLGVDRGVGIRQEARARPRTPTPPCTATRTGPAARAAASATTTGRPRRASRRSGAPRGRAAAGQRGEVQLDAAGPRVKGFVGSVTGLSRSSGAFWEESPLRARSPDDQPTETPHARQAGPGARRAKRPKPAAPPRIVILDPSPSIDGGRFAPKRTVGEDVAVSATIFPDGHDVLRAVVKVQGPRRPQVARGAAAPTSTRTSPATAGPGRSPSTRSGRYAVDDRGLGRPLRLLARGARAQGRLRPARPRRRAERGRRCCCEAAEARAKGGDRKLIEHAAARRWPTRDADEAQAPGRAGPRARRGDRPPPRPLAVRDARPSRSTLDVDRERARFGAWYELFPRSWGGFKGDGRAVPQIAALGFDVALPAADPPDRRSPTARAATTR